MILKYFGYMYYEAIPDQAGQGKTVTNNLSQIHEKKSVFKDSVLIWSFTKMF